MTNPITLALEPLKEAGLTVTVDGRYMLVTDDGLEFSREHKGLAGLRQFVQDTLYEYGVVKDELLAEPEELEAYCLSEEPVIPKEETVNYVEYLLKLLGRNAQPAADPPPFAPTPPEKGHRLDQLALAKELNARDAMMSPKELWQAQQNDGQDRGGIPNPVGYITEMKLAAPEVAVIVKGQTFQAPKGWKIKECRPSGKVLYYASILQEHKAENQARGAEFALVRV